MNSIAFCWTYVLSEHVRDIRAADEDPILARSPRQTHPPKCPRGMYGIECMVSYGMVQSRMSHDLAINSVFAIQQFIQFSVGDVWSMLCLNDNTIPYHTIPYHTIPYHTYIGWRCGADSVWLTCACLASSVHWQHDGITWSYLWIGP